MKQYFHLYNIQLKDPITNTIKSIQNIIIMLKTLSIVKTVKNMYYNFMYLLVTKWYINLVFMFFCVFSIRFYFYSVIFAEDFVPTLDNQTPALLRDELLKQRDSVFETKEEQERAFSEYTTKVNRTYFEAHPAKDVGDEPVRRMTKPYLPEKLPRGPSMAMHDRLDPKVLPNKPEVPEKPLSLEAKHDNLDPKLVPNKREVPEKPLPLEAKHDVCDPKVLPNKPNIPAAPLPAGPIEAKHDNLDPKLLPNKPEVPEKPLSLEATHDTLIAKVESKQPNSPATPLPEGPLFATKDASSLKDILNMEPMMVNVAEERTNIKIFLLGIQYEHIYLMDLYIENTFVQMDTKMILKTKDHQKLAETFFAIIEERIPKSLWFNLLEVSNGDKTKFIKLTMDVADKCIATNQDWLKKHNLESTTINLTNKCFKYAILNYADKIFSNNNNSQEYISKLTTVFRKLF